MALSNKPKEELEQKRLKRFAIPALSTAQQWRELTRLGGEKCRDALHEEIRRGELLVWLVVLFLFGIAFYFAAPQEPNLVICGVLAGAACITAFLMRHRGIAFFSFAGISALLLGFFAATVQTQITAQPTLSRTLNAPILARVESIEKRADGSRRIVLDVLEIQRRVEQGTLPNRIRLRLLSRAAKVESGDIIKANVRLTPPIGPVLPQGFDFAKDLFFKGIGASGFIFGVPKVVSRASDNVWRPTESVQRLRTSIETRVFEAFQQNGHGNVAGFATAVLVGAKGAIKQEDRRTLAVAGLAHLLAISGLHMALVFTFVMFASRAMLARASTLAIQAPIRGCAIGLGLCTTLGYYAISGGSLSATRAFIMVSVMALAMLFGRRALSVRNIALAALVILFVSPAALVGPGFQMSFMATLFLVSFSTWWLLSSTVEDQTSANYVGRLFHKVKRYALGLIITSSLAGLATAPIAAFHFNQVAPYGLAANLIGVPVFSLLVMPFGFLALLLMPFGYEVYPLFIMGQGIELIQNIGRLFEGLSAGYSTIGQLNGTLMGIVFLLMVMGALLKTKLRYAILGLAVGLIYFSPASKHPNILIAEDGKTVAVVERDGQFIVSGKRAGRFETTVWRRSLGIQEPSEKTSEKTKKTTSKFLCDTFGCLYKSANYLIAHVKHPSGFYEDCRRADIVISELSAPQYCGQYAFVVDRKALRAGGAHALYDVKTADKNTPTDFIIEKAIPDLKRPWHAHYK